MLVQRTFAFLLSFCSLIISGAGLNVLWDSFPHLHLKASEKRLTGSTLSLPSYSWHSCLFISASVHHSHRRTDYLVTHHYSEESLIKLSFTGGDKAKNSSCCFQVLSETAKLQEQYSCLLLPFSLHTVTKHLKSFQTKTTLTHYRVLHLCIFTSIQMAHDSGCVGSAESKCCLSSGWPSKTTARLLLHA